MRIPSFAKRLGKYCASSTLAVGIDFALLFLLVEYAYMNYLWAATISFTLGHSANYIISRRWNFSKTDRRHRVAYILFVGFGLISLGATVYLLKYLVADAGFHYLNARVLVGLIVGLCNFLFNYFVTFKAHMIPDDVDKF